MTRAVALFALVACSSDKGDGDATPDGGGTAAGELTLALNAEVPLMVEASWDVADASEAWVEYRFEGEDWLIAPTVATGEAIVIGIPEQTDVEARGASVIDGETNYTATATITTGDLPRGVPVPASHSFDDSLADVAGFGMITVAGGDAWFLGPYWVEIVDRKGRVVWYHEVPFDLISLSASVARDNTHIWFEASNIFGFASAGPSVRRQTLDNRWSQEFAIADLGQAISEGPDNSFFFERREGGYQAASLEQLDATGSASVVWDCESYFSSDLGLDPGLCLMNSCMWDEARNTLLASQFESSTVFEIDVATGEPVRQFGQLVEGDPYTFDPLDSMIAYQHFPHYTAEGTLMMSTHAPCGGGPGYCNENTRQNFIQLASEYTVDDATKTLTRVSVLESTDLWATQAGEAYKLPNGNIIQGYGQDAAVRELTPAGDVAWEVQWETDGYGYRLIGHLSMIEDLYALNRGQ